MTTKARRTFRDGPPKWTYTAFALVVVTVHLALAGFRVGQFAELWDDAWIFYSGLLATTTAGAVAIHRAPTKGG